MSLLSLVAPRAVITAEELSRAGFNSLLKLDGDVREVELLRSPCWLSRRSALRGDGEICFRGQLLLSALVRAGYEWLSGPSKREAYNLYAQQVTCPDFAVHAVAWRARVLRLHDLLAWQAREQRRSVPAPVPPP